MNGTSFNLAHIWAQGDLVTHGVALLLLAMSLASWTVILVKGLALLRQRRMAASALSFWHATSLSAGEATLQPAGPDNPYLQLVQRGTDATAHHAEHREELHGVLELNDWLASSLRQTMEKSNQRQQSGLSILASVGSASPFIGLFGTVWGIYHALASIGASGQASLDKVAGPVGESLVMTALGLAVAIPAVLGYNALVRGQKALATPLKHFAHDLHAYLITGGRLGTVQASDHSRMKVAA